ncbi:uncharacterized protein LOC131071814 [Cryptomeria japonica]|uniref:uncharacterized protein LOC131071814 n=1 Tax=Cryptomeria japonica TaxID=3369 RepID=UPI0027DA18C6|nr:uncharacterized protein LOC131071814 [Cryptomeria japonica]
MPFGLINAGATFQRVMDLSFGHLRDKIIVVYLDDLTVFSRKRKHHVRDLRKVLVRCREHGVSLNPKRSIFGVMEGKLLGHIVSQEGVKVDPQRVKAIQQLSLPSNRNGVRSFFGQVNLLRHFIPDFVETTKYIVNMMSEKVAFKWNEAGRKAFEEIKRVIAHAPTLVNLDFNKDFIIYCYASEHTMSGILVQKGEDNGEVPISFMSIPLKKHELKYSQIEKHAYAVVKAVKQFRYYILHSHAIVFVPNFVVGMFKDAYAWVARCEKSRLFIGKPQLAALPLRPVVIEEPFKQWGLDFIGPLNPISNAGHTHILIAIDYFTKWVEAIPVKKTTSEIVCTFLKDNMLVRFGVPQKIVTDNASNFSSSELSLFCYDHEISLAHASDYYPQGNGQAESSNKNLFNIMRKLVSENFRDWHKRLHEALWANRTSPKRAIGMSPFELVYGIGAQLSLPLELAASKLQLAYVAKDYGEDYDTSGIFPIDLRHYSYRKKAEETLRNMASPFSDTDKVSTGVDTAFQDSGTLDIWSHVDSATPPPLAGSPPIPSKELTLAPKWLSESITRKRNVVPILISMEDAMSKCLGKSTKPKN